jgi:hydroxymethylglutaryl-CoA synthase
VPLTDTPTILALGTYVPAYRLEGREIGSHWAGGGKGSRAVAGWDEDVVTMGTEAATLAVDAAGLALDAIDACILATATAPYAEHSSAAEVARALGLRADAHLVDVGASMGGVVAALALARSLVRAGDAACVLVIGADDRSGEPGGALETSLGSAAGAAIVGSGAGVALLGATAARHGVPTRWRAAGEQWLSSGDDPRFEREQVVGPAVTSAVSAVLDQAELTPDQLAFGYLGADARGAASFAKGLKCSPELALLTADAATIGDVGNAAPLLALAAAWSAQPVGARGVVVGIAPGAASTALLVEVTGAASVAAVALAPETIDYVEYLRRRGVVGKSILPDPVQAYSTGPAAFRDEPLASLSGDRCVACGSLNVPRRVFCIDCGAEEFEQVRVPRTGTLRTFNQQYAVAVAPEPAPLAVGVVRLDGAQGERGGNLSVMLTDTDLGNLAIGQPVALVMRRCGIEQGLVKYGWKGRVIREDAS